MPTISVPTIIKDQFSKNYTDESFSTVLFDYGLEVDDIVDGQYKIDIPANRHDLLCYNGLLQALNCYLGSAIHEMPQIIPSNYAVTNLSAERPYIACAIIKGMDLTGERYTQFIDYQDKLHLTLGRNRSIVSIGTHDLETIEFPIVYQDIPVEDISFRPLNGDVIVNKKNIDEYFANTSQYYAKKEIYPTVSDQRGILSLVPIINSDRSKINLNTKNVFIEVTGTDMNKVLAGLKLIIHNFRGCEVLSCTVNGVTMPSYNNQEYTLTIDEINKELGLNLSAEEIQSHLKK